MCREGVQTKNKNLIKDGINETKQQMNNDYLFDTVEEYVEAARENPDDIDAIVASAVMEMNFSVRRFVEELDFDYTKEILDLDSGEKEPVISHALMYCNVEEIQYLMSLPAMDVPFNAYDLLFTGKGSYDTWLDERAAAIRAPIISKIVDMLGNKLHGMELADWWYNDFCDFVLDQCDGKHAYLEYENLRNILNVPTDEE